MYLEQIHEANDIKKLNERELAGLAEEIRTFLVEKISKTGGHLASNLGVVELTMAMHLSFQLPEDKMIWDVGHQSYTHKILTGRKEGFDGLRKYGGMSGFPKRKESDCDAFDTGHSSTSISAGLGYARGRDILGQDYSVISVIGDGSLTGGMAYEALNNAAEMKTNFIIVLNDKMRIVFQVQAERLAFFLPHFSIIAHNKLFIRHEIRNFFIIAVERNLPLARNFFSFADEELLLRQDEFSIVNSCRNNRVSRLFEP